MGTFLCILYPKAQKECHSDGFHVKLEHFYLHIKGEKKNVSRGWLNGAGGGGALDWHGWDELI